MWVIFFSSFRLHWFCCLVFYRYLVGVIVRVSHSVSHIDSILKSALFQQARSVDYINSVFSVEMMKWIHFIRFILEDNSINFKYATDVLLRIVLDFPIDIVYIDVEVKLVEYINLLSFSLLVVWWVILICSVLYG